VHWFRVAEKFNISGGSQRGIILVETLVALAILGVVAVAFLGGLATTSRAVVIIDERATAESLARSQMEWAKDAVYEYEASGYSAAPIPGDQDYLNYSATIAASPINDPDDGIQKLTVTVKHHDEEVITLQGYKVDR